MTRFITRCLNTGLEKLLFYNLRYFSLKFLQAKVLLEVERTLFRNSATIPKDMSADAEASGGIHREKNEKPEKTSKVCDLKVNSSSGEKPNSGPGPGRRKKQLTHTSNFFHNFTKIFHTVTVTIITFV